MRSKTSTKKPKEANLPPQIYVYWENPGTVDESFLNSQETPSGIEEGTRVGIYKLVETKTMKITEELV